MARRRKKQYEDGGGEHIRLTLTGMGHRGMALGRHHEQVVFVRGGVPGETVEVEVLRRYNDYLEGRVASVITASPHRVDPPCQYYGECGGCQYQHIAYEQQLKLKRAVVEEQLRRIGKFEAAPVAPTLAAPSQWHYRNHARFTVNKEGLLGFVRPESHWALPIEECLLLDERMNGMLGDLHGHCAETRQLSFRFGVNTGEYLIQPRIKNPALSLETGQTHYHETLQGNRFRVASPSFFQVNTAQAERMAQVVQGYLDDGVGLLVDAYAGVGTFAVLLASHARRVLAVEESGPAVKDGRLNAEGVGNVEFVQGKVEEVLPQLTERPDVVLLDPPRAGCHQTVLDSLIRHRPRRVVYVSCEPATLARDLRILCDGGFTLREAQPVDMFPQTYHIECVALLEGQGEPTPRISAKGTP